MDLLGVVRVWQVLSTCVSRCGLASLCGWSVLVRAVLTVPRPVSIVCGLVRCLTIALTLSIGLWKLVCASVLLIMGTLGKSLMCGAWLIVVYVVCSLLSACGLKAANRNSFLGVSMWWTLLNMGLSLGYYRRYRPD